MDCTSQKSRRPGRRAGSQEARPAFDWIYLDSTHTDNYALARPGVVLSLPPFFPLA